MIAKFNKSLIIFVNTKNWNVLIVMIFLNEI